MGKAVIVDGWMWWDFSAGLEAEGNERDRNWVLNGKLGIYAIYGYTKSHAVVEDQPRNPRPRNHHVLM